MKNHAGKERIGTAVYHDSPQIMGGAPVIVGTCIPIERILFLFKDGYNIDAIHEEYPWVEKNILEGLLDDLAQLVNTTMHGPSLS